jgi:hypothetical protein
MKSKSVYYVVKEVKPLATKAEAKKYLQENQKSDEKMLLIRGKECQVTKEVRTKITIK